MAFTESTDRRVDDDTVPRVSCEPSPYAIFSECPHCAGEMRPEHAHYRCAACGWRDSCCD